MVFTVVQYVCVRACVCARVVCVSVSVCACRYVHMYAHMSVYNNVLLVPGSFNIHSTPCCMHPGAC